VAGVLRIARATEADAEELLGLMLAYCAFYAAMPGRGRLRDLMAALRADPEGEGVQLIARSGDDHRAVGFATVFWSWNTLRGGRTGILHDLFVAPEARGQRVGERLMEAAREECRRHGAVELAWETALDNERAQRLYDRIGAVRATWLSYSLEV
jgi:GNAT superfamily N-acetyltransferase